MKETSKNRHTVWLTDETWKMVGDQYKGDNCSTQNEYIEKAIRFYVGYRNAECDGYYLPNTLSYMLEGSLTALGDRIGRLLFKLSVEESTSPSRSEPWTIHYHGSRRPHHPPPCVEIRRRSAAAAVQSR